MVRQPNSRQHAGNAPDGRSHRHQGTSSSLSGEGHASPFLVGSHPLDGEDDDRLNQRKNESNKSPFDSAFSRLRHQMKLSKSLAATTQSTQQRQSRKIDGLHSRLVRPGKLPFKLGLKELPENNTVGHQVEDDDEPPYHHDDDVSQIRISKMIHHEENSLLQNSLLLRPSSLRFYVVDSNTGRCLSGTTEWNATTPNQKCKATVVTNEEANIVHHEWNSDITFPVTYSTLHLKNTLFLFEVMDERSALLPQTSNHRIAWAFFRPERILSGINSQEGRNNTDNIGTNITNNGTNIGTNNGTNDTNSCINGTNAKPDMIIDVQLQLYKWQKESILIRKQAEQIMIYSKVVFHPSATSSTPSSMSNIVPDVFIQYQMQKKKKFNSCLCIQVAPTSPPSMPEIDIESASTDKEDKVKEIHAGDLLPPAANKEEEEEEEEDAWWTKMKRKDNSTTRSRSDPEPSCCLPPNVALKSLYAGQYGASALSFSNSGRYIALASSSASSSSSSSTTTTVRIHSCTSETRLLHEFMGHHHASTVNDVVWSPNDEYILTASDDGTCKLWCTTNLLGLGVMGGDRDDDWNDDDGCETVRRRRRRRRRRTRRRSQEESTTKRAPYLAHVFQICPPSPVSCVSFLKSWDIDGYHCHLDGGENDDDDDNARRNTRYNGNYFVIAGTDHGNIHMWDIKGKKDLGFIGGDKRRYHQDPVTAIATVSHGLSRIFSGDDGARVIIWGLRHSSLGSRDGEKENSMSNENRNRDSDSGRDGPKEMSGEEYVPIRRIELRDSIVGGITGMVHCGYYLDNKKRSSSGSSLDGGGRLLINSGPQLFFYDLSSQRISHLRFTFEKKHLWNGYCSQNNDGAMTPMKKGGSQSKCRVRAAVSPDGSMIAGTDGEQLRIWSAHDGEVYACHHLPLVKDRPSVARIDWNKKLHCIALCQYGVNLPVFFFGADSDDST